MADLRITLDKVKDLYIKSAKQLVVDHFTPLSDFAKKTPETEVILNLARVRKERGNPPGKKEDYIGDELVWEILLTYCTKDDISIISVDGDWFDFVEKKVRARYYF